MFLPHSLPQWLREGVKVWESQVDCDAVCVWVCAIQPSCLTMAAPVLNVDPPSFLLLSFDSFARLPLGFELSVDAGHRRRVQRDVAQLRRSTQAEHRVVLRRPEGVQVPRRFACRRPDPKQLEARLHPSQHGWSLRLSATTKPPPTCPTQRPPLICDRPWVRASYDPFLNKPVLVKKS